MENKVQEKQPEFVAFPINTINEVLNYLSERPFKEVNSFIVALQKEGKILSNIQSDEKEGSDVERKAVEDVNAVVEA